MKSKTLESAKKYKTLPKKKVEEIAKKTLISFGILNAEIIVHGSPEDIIKCQKAEDKQKNREKR